MSGKNRILTGALIVAVLVQFALTTALSAQTITSQNSPAIPNYMVVTHQATAAVSTFTDGFLAIVLIWSLRRARSGLKDSDSIVNRLVIYIIASSSITAVCMLVALIASSVAPHTLIHLPSDFLLVKRQWFNALKFASY